MKIEQIKWIGKSGWVIPTNKVLLPSPNLVLAFGSRILLENSERYDELKSFYPSADILLCSTSGEILDSEVYDETIVVTAIQFEKTTIKTHSADVIEYPNSFEIGKKLAESFDSKSLKHLFVVSDGQLVNGSELVRGLNKFLPSSVTVTGGLAGDSSRFQKTLVGLNENPKVGRVCAVGFYGDNIKIGHGSIGGWDSFGPERLITKAEANVLYELDNQSALELYKKYLGEYASGLPETALLFPLSIKLNEDSSPIVRTILSIDEANNKMIFAGDLPEGKYVRLMKANIDRLIDGASLAADNSLESIIDNQPDLAILISCVGRKLVLGQRTEEEVEAVKERFGPATKTSGFYSYGEISPFNTSVKCELHNQTMTITTFSER